VIKKEIETAFWEALLSDKAFGPELQNLLHVGNLIWQRGWAEANAGNISLRLPQEMVHDFKPLFEKSKKSTNLTDFDWYLVSASGSRYREYTKLGFNNFIITGVEHFQKERNQIKNQIIFPDYRNPTSEWITHISVHNWLLLNRSTDKVVLHAHPTDWIILSNRSEYRVNKTKLINKITSCLPEISIYFPNGMVLLPYANPGSTQLADITKAALKKSNLIIWERHGILITAENVNTAFDYLEIMAKAAKVYLAME